MKTVYVGSPKTYADKFPLIPVYRDTDCGSTVVAFAAPWNEQILPLKGEEQFILLARLELEREHPEIKWQL